MLSRRPSRGLGRRPLPVPDDLLLPAAVAWLTAKGVRFAPGGVRRGAAGHDICFLHPKANDEFPISGEGVLIELVQAPPEVIASCGVA